MAINAKFVADFSSFIAAIDKAELALVDFGKGANKVESSLNRMVDNFSGRKMIQEAALMTIAVEKAGGTATLTAKELQQVGAKADEAADKMRRLGYEVPAGLQKLQQETKSATSGFESMKSVVSGLAGAFGVAFSLGAVISFGREILADADSLQKFHDKTGISVEGLQAMRIAGDDAGVSLESMSSAVTMLQKKLGTGDSGAVSALNDLGISVAEFIKLDGAAQMSALSKAIQDIDDPLRVASDLSKLFGKAWAEQLPALKRGFKELGDGTVAMSADTVEAIDAVGDALTRMARTAKGEAAQAFAFMFLGWGKPARDAEKDAKNLKTQIDAMSKAAQDARPGFGALVPPKLSPELDDIADKLGASAQKSIDFAAAAKKAKEEAEKFANAVKSFSFGTFVADTSKLNAIIPDLSGHMAEMADRFDDVREHADDLASSGIELNRVEDSTGAILGGTVIPMFSKLPDVVAAGTKQIENAGKSANKAFDYFGALEHVLGGVHDKFSEVANIGVKAASEIKKVADAAADAGEGFSKGDWIKVAVIGVSALASAIGKLFGNNAEKQINPVREAFVQLNGGLAALNEKAHQAGVTLTQMLDAKNPEQYKAAIDALNDAFKFQDDAMKTLDDTVAKYGFTLSELGPTFAAQKLNEQAGSLLQDYQVLTAAGVDHVAIINKMGPALQSYVHQAELTGAAIPESMRPVLQSMIDMGLLTDESGEAMKDLSKLTFAETLDKKFSSLIDTINKLTDAISRGLGTALTNIPQPGEIHIGVVYDYPDPGQGDTAYAASGGYVTGNGIQYLAGGGRVLSWPSRGSDTVRAMLTPGEGVVNPRGMKTLGKPGLAALNSGAGLGGAPPVDMSGLEDQLDGLRQDMADDRRLRVKELRDAILLAPQRAA